LGFYALRLDRTLNLSWSPAAAILEFPTRAGLTFELQSSTNFSTWGTIGSVKGDGWRHTWTNSPDAANAFYRIRITEE